MSIQVNSVGIVFVRTVKDQAGTAIDISGATTKQLIFRKADGSTITKATSFTTDGTDGKHQYTSTSGDLDVPGKWHDHSHIVTATQDLYSSITTFKVERNLET